MNFGTCLATLCKQRGLTEPTLTDQIDVHVSSVAFGHTSSPFHLDIRTPREGRTTLTPHRV